MKFARVIIKDNDVKDIVLVKKNAGFPPKLSADGLNVESKALFARSKRFGLVEEDLQCIKPDFSRNAE